VRSDSIGKFLGVVARCAILRGYHDAENSAGGWPAHPVDPGSVERRPFTIVRRRFRQDARLGKEIHREFRY
jgi:hypothetical protein